VVDNPVKAEISLKGEATRSEDKKIIDVRTFKEHETKEVEMWSWRKMRNEKWFVYSDCVNKKFKIRKLK
jgi:hypothetical protein